MSLTKGLQVTLVGLVGLVGLGLQQSPRCWPFASIPWPERTS